MRKQMIALAFFAGLLWATLFAQHKLADALPTEWEGRDVQITGVVASMPQPQERGRVVNRWILKI